MLCRLNNSAESGLNFEPWSLGTFSILATVRITQEHHNSQYEGCPPDSVTPECSQDWSQHPQRPPQLLCLVSPALPWLPHTSLPRPPLCFASKPLSQPGQLPHFLQVSAQISPPSEMPAHHLFILILFPKGALATGG